MKNDDPVFDDEESWVEREREKVIGYLQKENVDHLGVGEWPAYHVLPHLALWAVQSKRNPGWVGWWAISGDIPTDYMSRKDADHPRVAMAYFARSWNEASESMLCGKENPDIVIGDRESWPELGLLLKRRSEFLKRLSEDDAVWSEMERRMRSR